MSQSEQHPSFGGLGAGKALASYQFELQESLRQAVAEYELSSGYTTQAIKKTAFEL